jgi:glutamine synthetase
VAGDLTPPLAETADGVAPASTDVHAPEDLAAALTALEADVALVDAVGGELVANFVGIKRAEWERFTAAVTDWELKEYLWFC